MSKAKNKQSKRSSSIPNKVLYSRVSYLYQAAVYLATIAPLHHHPKNEEDKPKNRNNDDFELVTEARNDETNNLEIEIDIDDDDDLKTASPLSKNASQNAVVKVVVASKHVKQEDISNEALRNDGIDEKEKNIISQDQHDTDRTHNLHSLRLATTTLNSSRKLVSELRAVSLKTQIRLSPQIKHSICKSCSTILINGSTCSNFVENKSKGGKKPWADILIKKCLVCDSVKRFPISAQRQERRETRIRKKLFNGETPVGNRN